MAKMLQQQTTVGTGNALKLCQGYCRRMQKIIKIKK